MESFDTRPGSSKSGFGNPVALDAGVRDDGSVVAMLPSPGNVADRPLHVAGL